MYSDDIRTIQLPDVNSVEKNCRLNSSFRQEIIQTFLWFLFILLRVAEHILRIFRQKSSVPPVWERNNSRFCRQKERA